MVRGSPRHSESNGGVERVNCTVQEKLGAWMSDTGSRRWSVGCRFVQWRYNTQKHHTIRETLYHLMYGQLSHVGIASLHLDQNLLVSLATEAQLNCVAEYEGMVQVAYTDNEVEEGKNEEIEEWMN